MPLKNTNRVWDLVTGVQRYQFFSPADRPTCVVYAPPTDTATARGGEETQQHAVGDGDAGATPGGGVEAAGEERHLVAGYVSGAVRVFDVPSTSTLYELKQHRGAVQQVSLGRKFWVISRLDGTGREIEVDMLLYLGLVRCSKLKRVRERGTCVSSPGFGGGADRRCAVAWPW